MKIALFLFKFHLRFLKGPTNNTQTLIEIMVWCQTGVKPLCEPILVSLPDTYMRLSASMRPGQIFIVQN